MRDYLGCVLLGVFVALVIAVFRKLAAPFLLCLCLIAFGIGSIPVDDFKVAAKNPIFGIFIDAQPFLGISFIIMGLAGLAMTLFVWFMRNDKN